MNHWTSENALFAVTKLVHGSSVQFFHNMHCSLWYVLGHKCLALLPWQHKAASHTIRPLTVFFSFSLNVCMGNFFFFNLSVRCGIFEKFKISSNCKQKKVLFWNANPRKMLPNIDSHTKFSSVAQLKAPKRYGHKHFTGALLLFCGKP